MKLQMIMLSLFLVFILALPVSAMDFTAPVVPKSGASSMPENTDSFGEGLTELLKNVLLKIRPTLREALRVCVMLLAAVMLIHILNTFSETVKNVADFAGTISIATILLTSTNSMLTLGAETVQELSDYGRLLWPVMTTALAAQGGVTSSASIYTATVTLDVVISSLLAHLLMPMVYLFLALAIANSATGEEILKRIRDLVKNFMSWCMKTLLTVFMTYMSITGVISGTTDAAALKATRMTISSVVPVVGGILSDASESVLIGAGLMKNAAGVYGILALLSICMEPFAQIGVHYLLLKLTAGICGVFEGKTMTKLIEDFSAAMGLLLAMTGSACLLLLICAVCFMKGVG